MTSRGRRGRGIAIAVVALLASAPYVRSLSYPLLYDDRTLLDNPWLSRRARVRDVFTHDFWHGTRHESSDLYRPVTVLTLAWNLRAARGSFGFRGVNLLLHVAASLAVLAALDRLFRSLDAGEKAQVRRGPPGAEGYRPEAFAGAGLFAVHPLSSQVVMSAVGRAEILAALLGLLAFALVLDAARGRRPPGLAVGGSAVLLLAALCSKESAASWLPILGVSWVVGRRRMDRPRVPMVALAAWAVSIALFVAARGAVVGWEVRTPPWVDNPLVQVGAATRVANAVLLQGLYLLKMVFPLRLAVEYGYDQVGVLPLLPWGLPAALVFVGGWAGVAVFLGRASRAALWAWVSVPAAFAVTSNVAFPIGTIFAERLAYLPLVAACALGGWGLFRLAPAPRARLAILAALVVLLGARTAARTLDYRGLAPFWESAAAASPRSVKALANVGRTRLRLGHPAEAVEPLERAVSLWPDYVRALSLLGQAHERLGRPAEAARYLKLAEEADARRRQAPGQDTADED